MTTTQDRTRTGDAAWLSRRIGATAEAMALLAADIVEDEMTLALFANGTPPQDAGFAGEDECAAFIADAIRALTGMHAELDGLRQQLAALEAAEAGVTA